MLTTPALHVAPAPAPLRQPGPATWPTGVARYLVPEVVFGAISHQIGGRLDMPHGMLDAVPLPHVVRVNEAVDPTRVRPLAEALAEALGVGDAGHPADDEVGEALAQVIALPGVATGAPWTLREIGVTEPDLPALARQTPDDDCLTTNPRELSEADVMAILQAAL